MFQKITKQIKCSERFLRKLPITIIFLITLFFSNCSKKNQNKKLAFNYYKMSILDLETEILCERNYKNSLQNIEKAIIEDPENAYYLAHKATVLFLINKTDESEKVFKQALSIKSEPTTKPEILNNYACLLARSGKTEQALKTFELLENDKNYLTPELALVNQAKIYSERKDYQVAKTKLAQAIQNAKDYVDAHYYLGVVSFLTKDFETSRQAIEKTILLDPTHNKARDIYAMLEKQEDGE